MIYVQRWAQEVRDPPSQVRPAAPSPQVLRSFSIMISSHRSYFVSQINLQNSTEILCVLIAPVKTSETLPSARAAEAARGLEMLSRDRGAAAGLRIAARPAPGPPGRRLLCDVPGAPRPAETPTAERRGDRPAARDGGSLPPAPRAPLGPGEAAVPGRPRRRRRGARSPSAPAPPLGTHGPRGLPRGAAPPG